MSHRSATMVRGLGSIMMPYTLGHFYLLDWMQFPRSGTLTCSDVGVAIGLVELAG